MTMWWLRRFGVVFALSIVAAADADACSCMTSGPPCQAAWTADAIFTGTVRSIDSSDQRHIVTRFDIDRAFLNVSPGTVELVSTLSTCSYRFDEGKKYLVYAWKSEDGQLSTGICSRTRLLAEAEEDLRYLTSLPASGTGGRVYGRINEMRRDPAESMAVDFGPLERVTISIRGATFMREVVTDARGRFEVTNLPLGKVTVAIVPPFGFDARGLEREFEIGDLRACGEANFSISQSAKASGVVVDASGRPMAGVEVDAVAAELAGFDPPPYQNPVKTDDRGIFEFDDLPPGTFVFGVHLTKRPGAAKTGQSFFLPGTAIAREATVVELKGGDRKEVGVLRLAGR